MRHSQLPDAGQTNHFEIDTRLPTRHEKDAMTKADTPTADNPFLTQDSDIPLDACTAATYDNLKDWFATTQSSGKISGGSLTDNGDGTTTIGAGTGIFRATSSAVATAIFCDWSQHANLSLVDNTTNYIYVDYNSGSPTVHATTTKTATDNRVTILLGKIFREGTTLHLLEAGMVITELAKAVLTRFVGIAGETARASGAVVAESGARYLTTTTGVIFAGLTRVTTAAQDTTGADTFEAYYRAAAAGEWTQASVSQIDNVYWDDDTGTLNTLTSNRYGVHWIYVDADGHIATVYGRGDYTLALAEAAQPPSDLPTRLAEFAFIAAKIIVKKNATNLYAIESAYTTTFTPAGATIHSELTTLGWTDAGHTGTANKTAAFDASGVASEIQELTTTASPTFDDVNVDGDIKLDEGAEVGITSDIRVKFDATNGRLDLILGDAAGVDEVRVVDSGGTAVVALDSDGNGYFAGRLGVGTTPATTFHIKDAIASALFRFESSGGLTNNPWELFNNRNTGRFNIRDQVSGNIPFKINPGVLNNAIRAGVLAVDVVDFNEKLVIDLTAGRVGINDASPSHTLDVNGGINTTDAYHVDDTQVVTNQQAAIADVATSGSATAAANATAINSILATLRTHGLIAT